MKKMNKILVAIDFSDHSILAAKYAVDLAKDVSAALVFSNILNQRDIDMANKAALRTAEFSAKKFIDETLINRRTRLEALVQELDTGDLDIDISISIGVPYKALLNDIELKKPDLLVMGTKGKSSLVDMIIGSCAQKMFRRSPIPLLSIREPENDI